MQALSSKVAAASTLAQKAVAAPRSRKSVSVRAVAAPTTTKLNTKRSEEVRATHCAGQGRNPRPERQCLGPERAGQVAEW